MIIIILYDNNARPGFESGWGFSCLVDHTQRILFDTGDDGPKLINNFQKAHIDRKSVNKVVLSHNHWDHIDGLKGFQKFNSEADVIRPNAFSAPTEISPSIQTNYSRQRYGCIDVCNNGWIASAARSR